jgi:triacylglycerol lipase
MVHGIWDKGTVFRRMAKVLTEQGHNCHAPDLEPANGAHGLADLAQKLERTIDQTLGSHTRLCPNWLQHGIAGGTLLHANARRCF